MTDLREVLDVRHPILLGAFGGMSSVALTAAVSNAGGLGAYGLYGYDGARIRETVTALREATDRPFALNIWLPTGDEVEPSAQHTIFAQALEPFYEAVGVEVPHRPERYLPSFDEQLDAIWDAAPAALSVVYGVPSAGVVEEAHRRGITMIGTATTVAEAVALEAGASTSSSLRARKRRGTGSRSSVRRKSRWSARSRSCRRWRMPSASPSSRPAASPTAAEQLRLSRSAHPGCRSAPPSWRRGNRWPMTRTGRPSTRPRQMRASSPAR